MDPKTAAAISYLAAAALAVAYIIVSDASLVITPKGGFLAIIAGICTGIGLIATYIGLSIGSTTVVSTLSGMYFVVAAIIGMLVLGDEITISKLAGVVFAIIAVVLLAR